MAGEQWFYLNIICYNKSKLKKGKFMQRNRSKLERKLDEINHTMELIRTVIPILILTVQIIILIKLFG